MRRRATIGALLGTGLVIAVVLAFVVGPRACSSPDCLVKVAADKGLDRGVQAHALADGPLADYAVPGVDVASISTGLAAGTQ